MTKLTVWVKQDTNGVLVHQLSDDPSDGSAAEQVAVLERLDAFEGYTCVSEDFTGSVPNTDPSLWSWNGTSISSNTPVPESITPVQLRLTLSIYGMLPTVEAMVDQLGETEKIYWQYASSISRSNPILNGMAAKMNLSKEQVDEMFAFAATL